MNATAIRAQSTVHVLMELAIILVNASQASRDIIVM